MLNRMKEKINQMGFIFKYAYNYKKNESKQECKTIFFESDINEEGMIVNYDPTILQMSGIAIAGMQVIQMGTKHVPRFIYDDMYKLLSKETQEFIKYHELGHFELQLECLIDPSKAGRFVDREIEADMYGYMKIGKENTVNALKEIKKVLLYLTNFDTSQYTITEIDVRIKAAELEYEYTDIEELV